MIFRLGGFDYIKVAPGDVRLRPCVADYLGKFARDTPVITLEQVGNMRESRGGRKMAASTCSVVSRPAPIPARSTLNNFALSQHK